MKKKLLASGIAAALTTLAGSAGATLLASPNGWGHINVIPYYNVQDGNETNISITNPDLVNGKAVKVRFRGAEWSDDVLDFTVFLSPGDQWTGVFADVGAGGTGVALISNDSTCTSPEIPTADKGGVEFQTGRLDTDKRTTGALEGYIEVIVLADIPPITSTSEDREDHTGQLTASKWDSSDNKTHTLYNAIKHKAERGGKPACRTDDTAQKLIDDLIEDNWWVWHDGGAASNFDIGGLASNASVSDVDDFNLRFGQPNVAQFGANKFRATKATAGNNGAYTVEIDGDAYSGGAFGGTGSTAVTAAAEDDWLQPSGWNQEADSKKGVGVYGLIVNPSNSRAFTIPAEAYTEGTPIKLFFKQDGVVVAATDDDRVGAGVPFKRSRDYSDYTSFVTADRIFYPDSTSTTAKVKEGLGLELLEFDLPDLSTPTNEGNAAYTSGNIADDDWNSWGATSNAPPAFRQRGEFAKAIKGGDANGHPVLITDFATDAASEASTDVVLSQPLRRYYYQYDKGASSDKEPKDDYNRLFGYYTDDSGGATSEYYYYYGNVKGDKGTAYEALSVDNADNSSGFIPVATCPVGVDSEEFKFTVTPNGNVSFSPKPPSGAVGSCGYLGEVAVVDINGISGAGRASNALGAILTRSTYPFGVTNGWATFGTQHKGTGTGNAHPAAGDATNYPIIGFKATNYSGGLARSIVLPFKY
jgi:hypothetical protein